MEVQIQTLSREELDGIHERTLHILKHTGVKVHSARARKILSQAGAEVDEAKRIIRFPTSLVEAALNSAPKDFQLGGRRPGWKIQMNRGECTLLADGEASWVVNADTGEKREGTEEDWLKATQLIDAIDEIGIYWRVIGSPSSRNTSRNIVRYWREVFSNFSKHVQESTDNVEQSHLLLETLTIIFGSREIVEEKKPFSFLLCPVSPLVVEEAYTDAYLEATGMKIPVAVMPMPILGLTSPASLVGTTILGNCEVLTILCLVQANAPGTPFIYAPALAVSDPRTGRYTGGAIEHALLSINATQMARYYNLPVEASTGGTHQESPGIQASYERALNWVLPVLAWPDILVGPGQFGGSTVLSFEQLFLDVEVFRNCRHLYKGNQIDKGNWLDEVITRVGPEGNFLTHPSTRDALRRGTWYINRLGSQNLKPGRNFLEEIRVQINETLNARQSIPLAPEIEKELDRLETKARRRDKE